MKKNQIERNRKLLLPLAKIVEGVYGISLDVIFGDSRKHAVSDARRAAIYLAKSRLGLSFYAIDQVFDRANNDGRWSARLFRRYVELAAVEPKVRNRHEWIKRLVDAREKEIAA